MNRQSRNRIPVNMTGSDRGTEESNSLQRSSENVKRRPGDSRWTVHAAASRNNQQSMSLDRDRDMSNPIRANERSYTIINSLKV